MELVGSYLDMTAQNLSIPVLFLYPYPGLHNRIFPVGSNPVHVFFDAFQVGKRWPRTNGSNS